jgi:prophage endopeptidase
MGDAGTVELAPAAGQSVFDIRAGIIADQAALRAAQAYIRDVCR